MSAKVLFSMLALSCISGVLDAATLPESEHIPEWLFGLLTLAFAALLRSDVAIVMARVTSDRVAQVRLAVRAGLLLLIIGGAMRLMSLDRLQSTIVANLGLISVLWGQYRAGCFRADAASFSDR